MPHPHGALHRVFQAIVSNGQRVLIRPFQVWACAFFPAASGRAAEWNEWRAAIADAVVETHDQIVGKTWRDAKKLCDARITAAKTSLQETLRSFKNLGAALLEAKVDDAPLDPAVADTCGWHNLEGLVAMAAQLGQTMSADPLTHVVQGYHRFRRYAPRMLRALDIKAAPVAEPLMAASKIIRDKKDAAEKPITEPPLVYRSDFSPSFCSNIILI